MEYIVNTPDGVTVDKSNVEDGTALLITYNRTGFKPVSYKVTVKSIGSRLYTVNGDTITVKSAEEAGITFSRKVGQETNQPLNMVIVENKRATATDNKKDVVTTPASSGSGDPNTWLKMLICGIAGIIVGFILANVLRSGSSDEEDDEPTTSTNIIDKKDRKTDKEREEREERREETDHKEEVNVYAQKQAELEQHDLKFLKKIDVWCEDSIQSDKYKDLFYALERGDIYSLLDHEYSQLPDGDNNLNGWWQTIRNDIDKLQADGNEAALTKCSTEMIRLSRSRSCNIHELASSVKGIAHPAGAGNASRGQ